MPVCRRVRPYVRTVTAADSGLEPPLLLLAAIIVSIRRCSSSEAALEPLAKLAADEREDLNSSQILHPCLSSRQASMVGHLRHTF